MEMQKCPLCGNQVSNERFLEIQSQIRAEEQKRLAETETALREQLAIERQAVDEQAARRIAAATSDRDAALERAKLIESREESVREQARQEALRYAEQKSTRDLQDQRAAFDIQLGAAAKRLADLEARETAIRMEARDQALKNVETTLEGQRQKYQQLDAERNRALQKVLDVQNELRAATELAERRRQSELADQRIVLEADRNQKILKSQAEHARERERWQKEVLDLQHKLANKTADEIGNGAELDLFETLKGEFETDNITRIKKGQPGADIRHEIRHHGELCGTIVYDSKNRQSWQLTYATKLRQDQLDAKADHAILTTTVFPSGEKELCLESEVIAVHPARAVYIVHLLRQHLISMHVRGLSLKERVQKTDRLYAYVISSEYKQKFGRINQLTSEMLGIEIDEQKAHDLIWRRRGTLLKRQEALARELDTEINAIIEGTENSRKPAA